MATQRPAQPPFSGRHCLPPGGPTEPAGAAGAPREASQFCWAQRPARKAGEARKRRPVCWARPARGPRQAPVHLVPVRLGRAGLPSSVRLPLSPWFSSPQSAIPALSCLLPVSGSHPPPFQTRRGLLQGQGPADTLHPRCLAGSGMTRQGERGVSASAALQTQS